MNRVKPFSMFNLFWFKNGDVYVTIIAPFRCSNKVEHKNIKTNGKIIDRTTLAGVTRPISAAAELR